MLSSLSIKGYKSIDSITLPLKKLNLLVGGNSVGKSSIIQSLLIFSQNVTELSSTLSGHFLSLESFREIRNLKTRPDKIEFEVIFQNSTSCKKQIWESDDSINFTSCENCSKKDCTSLNYTNSFHYLSADRIGNLEIYSTNSFKKTKIGVFGEFAIDYFEKNKSSIILDSLIKDSSDKTLGAQVNFWLKYITGYELKTEKIDKTNFIKGFYSKDGFEFRGKNVGAGLGYLISIIILTLSSKINDIIIIENPEIHLHPKAQALLIEFLTFVSNSGIQIILETHSDHIFNGTRVAIKEDLISPNDVSINFFSLNEKYITKHTLINLNEDGKVLNHVPDLFEQFDLDLNRLLGL